MHEHKQPIYTANNILVCDECITDEQKNGNECYCICHLDSKLQCKNCNQFHRQNRTSL